MIRDRSEVTKGMEIESEGEDNTKTMRRIQRWSLSRFRSTASSTTSGKTHRMCDVQVPQNEKDTEERHNTAIDVETSLIAAIACVHKHEDGMSM